MRKAPYNRPIDHFLNGPEDWPSKRDYPEMGGMVSVELDNRDGESVYIFASAGHLNTLTKGGYVEITGGDFMGRFAQWDFAVLECRDYDGGRFWMLVGLSPEDPDSVGVAGNRWTHDVFIDTFMHWAGWNTATFIVPDIEGVWYGICRYKTSRPYAVKTMPYSFSSRWRKYLGALQRWTGYPITFPVQHASVEQRSGEGGEA